jgi:hypothetical protein
MSNGMTVTTTQVEYEAKHSVGAGCCNLLPRVGCSTMALLRGV